MTLRSVTVSFLVVALAGCDGATTAGAPPAAAPTARGSVTTKVTSFSVSLENLNVDRVGLGAGLLRPDGTRDLAFNATVDGPFDALFVVSTNERGQPGYGLRADTQTNNDEVPPELGGVIDTGKMTIGIGVSDGGTFINGENGSVRGSAGIHNFTLYIPNTAALRPGSFVRLYVRSNGVLVPGPVTPY